MKKYLFSFLALAGITAALVACGSDDESLQEQVENRYFTIENATFTEGTFPQATTNDQIDGFSINARALAGGMNFVTVVTQRTYNRFYIGLRGIDGYWTCTPSSQTQQGDYHTYIIPINYSTGLEEGMIMLVAAQDDEGNTTTPYETEIDFVESLAGDLTINLTFNNDKDVDLHLFTPGGTHIYYRNRGGSYTKADGTTGEYGLDHDSNPGCSIDHLNNENIVIPSELIEPGTYTVKVDMYENCDASIPTSWAILTRYNNELIRVATGRNPATGVYAAGAGNGDMTEVMTFVITPEQAAAARRTVSKLHFNPSPITEAEADKMEEARYIERMSQK
ncbi:MAG: hypothetical protein IJT30_02215 [Muribaculaceae bacterium]|nr:hypothetical protein [Muribaculaceae bacterium]